MFDNLKTNKELLGHVVALVTSLVWGATFVSTKVLLDTFTPFEIMVSRFILAFLFLCAIRPRILKTKQKRHEFLFAAAGLTGVIGYFMLENVALTMTTASNVSIAVDTAPMFIALIATVIGFERALKPNFVMGFVIAMAGVLLISIPFAQLGSSAPDSLIPGVFGVGELLAVSAALSWGVYSNIVARLGQLGYETLPATKRIFLWGLIWSVVLIPVFKPEVSIADYLSWETGGNLLYLGLIASGCCFVTWGKAVEFLGPARSGIYLYLQPVTTCLIAHFALGEDFTLYMGIGVVLVLGGLIFAQRRFEHIFEKKKRETI